LPIGATNLGQPAQGPASGQNYDKITPCFGISLNAIKKAAPTIFGTAEEIAEDRMDQTLLNDAARALHLLGLALGFGVAIVADMSAARLFIRPLDAREIATLHRFHRMVALGLVLFWISGLVLLWLRTGFDVANFSPKLLTKLGVVTFLTVNAILIRRLGLPVIEALQGRRFGALGRWPPNSDGCPRCVVDRRLDKRAGTWRFQPSEEDGLEPAQ
jgi:hypothetical protein